MSERDALIQINERQHELVRGLEARRAVLAAELDEAASNCAMYKQQLLVAQADVSDLRFALHTIAVLIKAEHPHTAQAIFDRLATPSDTSLIDALQRDAERNEDALSKIRQWCDAYPLDIFPEPDFAVAQRGLAAVGITIDAVSASNMRHVLKGVQEIITAAIGDSHEP